MDNNFQDIKLPTGNGPTEPAASVGYGQIIPTLTTPVQTPIAQPLAPQPITTVATPTAPAVPLTPVETPAPKAPFNFRKFGKIAGIIVLILLVISGVTAVVLSLILRENEEPQVAGNRFENVEIPLEDLAARDDLSLLGTRSLVINGPLVANEAFTISPSGQPSNASRGQIYYDQNSNELAYYNGTQFVGLGGGVQSVGGLIGEITVGQGLGSANGQITNTGVLSLQGQTGDVTLIAGTGISIDGTTITNTGATSFGGQTGEILVGAGLNMTGNTLTNSGIISAAGGSGISVVNDGNGNITISNSGAGTGTVQSPGGTPGRLAKFTGVQTIADSLLSESGTVVTVDGDLSVAGGLTLGTALSVSNGGTGATSLTDNGVVIGHGSGALTAVAAGGPGECLMSTAGAPAFQACPGGGGVTSLNGLTGALTVANATAAGSTITIDDASTSQKGIAQFDATNFTALAGVINTIQGISTAASPTFTNLTLSGDLAVNGGDITSSGALNITPGGALVVGATGQTLTMQGSVTTITSNGGGNNIILNSAGTIELQDNTNVTGNLDTSGTLTAGTANAFQVAANGDITSAGNATLQGGIATIGSASQAGSVVLFDGSSNTGTVQTTALGANRVYTLPDDSGTICLSTGNCAGAGVTLQAAYNNSATPEIVLDATRGALTLRDNATPIAANLFEVQNNAGSTTYLAVTSAGMSVTGTATVSGNINSSGGALQTGGTARIDNTGNAVNIGNITLSGAISGGTTYTGSGNINSTAGALQTAGVTRVDNTGNLLNIGNLTATGAITIASTGGGNNIILNSAGTIELQDNTNVTGNLDISGTLTAGTANAFQVAAGGDVTTAGNATLQGGSVTVGTTSQAGSLILNDGSANTAALLTAALGANRTYTLPDATGTICLDTGNCGGAGVTLQTAYNNSTNPEITVDATRGALTVRDNATPIAANLFEVQNNAGNVTYFGVTVSGVDITGTATATGNINSSGGALQTGGTTRIDNAGNATNIGNIGLSGTISGGTTYTGSGNINTTAGALQTAGVTRVDNTGNLVNIGNLTATGAITIASTGGGNNIILNSAGTIELQDNTNVTGNLDVSGTLTAGTANAFQVAAGGDVTTAGNAILQGGTVTIGTTSQNGSLVLNDGSSNTGSLLTAALGANRTYTLPDASGTICLDTGNCAGAGVTLQTAYNGSTTPEIVLDATRGALTVRDNATPLAANLLEVQSNDGTTTYLAVTALGVSVTGATSATGNINSSGGALQTGGTTRIDNSGNATNIGNITLSGAISGGTTYTGSGNINTSGGALQTAGTTRVDSTGNLLNIGNLTATGAITIASTGGGNNIILNSAGTIELQDSTNITGNLDVSGTLTAGTANAFQVAAGGDITSAGNATLQGGSVNIGTTSQAGSLALHDGSSNTGTLQVAALGQNTTYILPDPGGPTATICLTTGNCAGSGGGVTGSGNTNRLSKFTSDGSTIGNSTITDDGTNVTTTVDMVVQGGDLTVGTSSQLASLILHDGNGQSTTLQAGDSSGNLTFILPTAVGNANQCLKQSGTGNQLVWQDCDGGGGGSSATLQTAYNNGNVISTTEGRDIDITLGNWTTDPNFDLVVADGSTGFVSFTRADGGGAADPAQMLLIDNLDATRALPIGIKLQAAGGGMTAAIDATDVEIVDALRVAGNNIVGTTGNIDFDNFDVAGATGNITTAGDLAVNGGDITSTGALNITPGGALTVGATGQTALFQGSTATITSNGASNDIVLNSADTIELQDNTNVTGNLNQSGGNFTSASTGNASVTAGGSLTLTGGGGSTWGTTSGNLTIQAAGTDTLTLQTVGNGTVSLGGQNSNVINIGGTSNIARTITVGTGATSQAQTVTIGSTAGTSVTTLQAGTGNLMLQAAGAGTTGRIQVGAGGVGSSTPDYFALDVKSDTGDPAGGAEGFMYYNTLDNKFRCYQGGGWVDCITADTDTGVTTIGAIDSQTKSANGAVITGNSLVLQTADGSFPGLVSTGTQTFAGDKTFSGDVAVNGGDITSSGALNITPGGALIVGSTGQTATFQGTVTTITSSGAGNDIVLNSADRISLLDATDVQTTSSTALRVLNAGGTVAVLTVDTSTPGVIVQGAGASGSGGRMYFGSDSEISIGENGAGNSDILALDARVGHIFYINGSVAAEISQNGLTTVKATVDANGGLLVTQANDNRVFGVSTAGGEGSVDIGYASDLQATVLYLDADATADPTGAEGGMYYNNSTNKFRCYQGSAWTDCISTGDGGVTSIGVLDSQTKSANGAVITGSSLVLQNADASFPGLVSTGAQTFAGNKTFSGDIAVNGGDISSSGALTIGSGAGTDTTINGGGQFVVQDASQFNGQVGVDLSANSEVYITGTGTGTNTRDYLIVDMVNNTTTGTQRGALIQNGAGTGVTEALLVLDNTDTDTAVTTGLQITAAAGGVTTAIDLSDADITDAINIGANNIVGTTGNIDLTNFDVVGASGNTTIGGDLAANGNTTIGNANTDTLTVTAILQGASPLVFEGATADANELTLAVATLNADRTITLPDEDGTVCLQNATTCGFALSSGSGNYIQNQNAVDQTANFRISGTGRATIALIAPALRPITDSTTALQIQNAAGTTTALTVDTTNLRVGVGGAGAPEEALDVIGNLQVKDAGDTKSYRVRTGGSSIDLESAGAQLVLSTWENASYGGAQQTYLVLENATHVAQALGTWQFRTAAFSTIRHSISGSAGENVAFNQNAEATNFTVQGDTDADLLFVQGSTDRVGIGTNTPGFKLDVDGTLGVAGNTTLTGDLAVNGGDITSTGTLAVTSTNFNLSSAGVVTLAGGQATDILAAAIATANGTGASLSLAGGSSTSSTCGTACTGGDLVLQGGAATGGSGTRNGGDVVIDAGVGASSNGAILIGTNSSADVTIGRTTSSSTSTLQAGGLVVLETGGAGTVGRIQIGAGGAGSATPDYLALDVKNNAGDPAGGAAGYIYYNANSNTFRCFTTSWGNCAGAGSNPTLQNVYDNSSSPATITTTDGKDVVFAMADTATDANLLVNLQCTTTCSTNGRFAVQNGGNDVLTVSPNSTGVTIGNNTLNTPVTINSGTGTIAIGTGAQARAINIGTGAAVVQTIAIGGTGANVITIGNTQTGGSIAMGAAMTTGTITIGGTGAQTGTIGIGTGTGAQAISLGTGGTGVKTIAIGGSAANVITIGNTQTGGSLAMGAAMTTGTITIGGTGAQTGTIGIGIGTGAQAINLGTGGTGIKTIAIGGTAANVINIGNTQTGGSLNLGAAMTSGTITIGGTGAQTGTIGIGTGTGAQTINFGTGGTGAKTVTLGSAASSSSTSIQSGTSNINLTTNGSAAGIVAKSNVDGTNAFRVLTSGNVELLGVDTSSSTVRVFDELSVRGSGVDSQNGMITFGTPAAWTPTIRGIDDASVGWFGEDVLSIEVAGLQMGTGTGDPSYTLDAFNGRHTLRAQNGFGYLQFLNAAGNTMFGVSDINGDGEATFRGTAASNIAFRVLNSSTVPMFQISTTTDRIYIGNPTADSTGALLVLDTKDTSGDPTGVAGGMYYNSSSNTFRCYENGAWYDCISRHKIVLGSDVTDSSGNCNSFTDLTGLSFSVSSGVTYNFYAHINYTTAATTTGSEWSINGPTASFLTYKKTTIGDNATTNDVFYANAYNAGSCTSSTPTNTGALAIIEGTVTPSSSGTLTPRMATEVDTSALTAKAGSTIEWW